LFTSFFLSDFHIVLEFENQDTFVIGYQRRGESDNIHDLKVIKFMGFSKWGPHFAVNASRNTF
jgi:hypothetical protein